MVPRLVADTDLVAALSRRAVEPFVSTFGLRVHTSGRIGQVWHARQASDPAASSTQLLGKASVPSQLGSSVVDAGDARDAVDVPAVRLPGLRDGRAASIRVAEVDLSRREARDRRALRRDADLAATAGARGRGQKALQRIVRGPERVLCEGLRLAREVADELRGEFGGLGLVDDQPRDAIGRARTGTADRGQIATCGISWTMGGLARTDPGVARSVAEVDPLVRAKSRAPRVSQ